MTTATITSQEAQRCPDCLYLRGSLGCLTQCGSDIALCGTNRGYRRHLRRRELACWPCRAAHAEAALANYHARRTAGGAR